MLMQKQQSFRNAHAFFWLIIVWIQNVHFKHIPSFVGSADLHYAFSQFQDYT